MNRVMLRQKIFWVVKKHASQKESYFLLSKWSTSYYSAFEASQLLKSMACVKSHNKNMVDEAMAVYDKVELDKRNFLLVNNLLHIFQLNKKEEMFLKLCKNIFDNCQDLHHLNKGMLVSCLKKSTNLLKKNGIKLNATNNNNTKQSYTSQDILNSIKIIGDYDNSHLIKNDCRFATNLISICTILKETKYALKIFNTIPNDKKNIVCIGAIMKCLNDSGKYNESKQIYNNYQNNIVNIEHNDITNGLYLVACIETRSFEDGARMIEKHNLFLRNKNDAEHLSIQLLTTLIQFYGAMGNIKQCLDIFDHIPTKIKVENSVCIGVMMKCLNNHFKYRESQALFEKFYNKNSNSTDSSRLCVLYLAACIETQTFKDGERMIKTINININGSSSSSIELLNTLIHFYGAMKNVDKAKEIFDNIPTWKKDCVTIGAMMKCFNDNGKYNQSKQIYQSFNKITADNNVAQLLYLGACIELKTFDDGEVLIKKQLRDVTNSKRNSSLSIGLLNTLIHFYGAMGKVNKAMNIFDAISDDRKNGVCINAMMKCLNRNDKFEQSKKLFDSFTRKQSMLTDWNLNTRAVNDVMCLLYLSACAELKEFGDGEMIIAQRGLDGGEQWSNMVDNTSIELLNTIIHFYGVMGKVDKAMKLFDVISDDRKDIVCVSAMMKCLNGNGMYRKSKKIFDNFVSRDNDDGNNVDNVACALYLGSCIETNTFNDGLKLISNYKLNNDVNLDKSVISIELVNTLIHFYGEMGDVDEACKLFNNIPDSKKDVICIGSMMKCLNTNGHFEKSKQLFDMKNNSKHHDSVTCIMYLGACIETFSFQDGQMMIKKHRLDTNYHEMTIEMLSTLIHFYASINDIDKMIDIFSRVPTHKQNVVFVSAFFNGLVTCQEFDKVTLLYDAIKNNNGSD